MSGLAEKFLSVALSAQLVLDSNLELDLQIQQMVEKKEGLWQCKVCGKTLKRKDCLAIHAETHIEGFSHSCHICNKTFSNRSGHRTHVNTIHSEIFTCNNCGKSEMNRKAFRNHKHL